MVSAAVIAILGSLYLLFDFLSVSAILFTASAMLGVMGASLFLEQRSMKAKSVGEYIFSICFFVLCITVFIAAVASL